MMSQFVVRIGFIVMCVAALLVADSAMAGTIQGEIKFEGKTGRRRPVDMAADANCQQAHGDAVVLSERYEHAEGTDNLVHVFVYISDGADKTEAPSTPAVLDQHGCVYLPHVLGVVKEQVVNVHNSDNTLHNVNCKPEENDAFNRGMGPGTEMQVAFDEVEMGIDVKCDVHPWMSGYIHVMEHPYFAVSDSEGKFKIENVPAGKYELSVWYETNRYAPAQETIEVEVGEDETVTADFTYSRAK
jgi:hypothetical protein